MLATGAPKLPSFAEATSKTVTSNSSSTAPASQFTYKPVFATEQTASDSLVGRNSQTVRSSITNSETLFTETTTTSTSKAASAAIVETTASTASTGAFILGTTAAGKSTGPALTSTSVFGQLVDPKASVGGFQFSVEPTRTTASGGSLQFSAFPSTSTSTASLPSYSSAVSVPTTSSSSIFAFVSTSSTTHTSVANTSSNSPFNFKPYSTGIALGNTGGTFGKNFNSTNAKC